VDLWLRVHWPLVWRSRVLFFLVGSALLANALLIAAGMAYPVGAERLPHIGDVTNMGSVLYGTAWVVIGSWAYDQVRWRLHELRPRGYAALTVVYAACILSVLLNPSAFAVPLVTRMADAVPDEAFREELAFHAAHNFWVCDTGLSEATMEANRERITASLRRYGLASRISFDASSLTGRGDSWCEAGPMPSVLSQRSDGRWSPVRLADAMESLQAAKAFRVGRGGPYAHYVEHLPRYAILSVFLGMLLTVLVTQRTTWRRLLDPYGNRWSLPRVRFPVPAAVHRIDDWLLVRRPLAWATRVHVFTFMALAYGALVVGAIVGVLGLLVEEPLELIDTAAESFGDVAGLMLFMGIGGLLAAGWAAYQWRVRLPVARLWPNQAAMALFLLATSVMPLIALAVVLWRLGGGENAWILGILLLWGSWFVTGVAFAAKHAPGWMVAVAVLLAVAVVAGLALLEVQSFGPIVVAWLVFGALLLPLRSRAARPGVVLAATLHLMLAAVVCGFLAAWVFNDLNESYAITIGVAVPASFLIFGVFTAPATRILLRHRFWPRAE
jgi:hypothetical protein